MSKNASTNRIYVIGNGFDLHHQLDTSYSSFGRYLAKSESEIHDQLLEFFGFPDITDSAGNDPLWSEFEANLAKLDSDILMEAFSSYLAVPSSPDFRDRDWGSFAIEIERVVDNLTEKLFAAFKAFILKVDYSHADPRCFLGLDHQAQYLSFNYTRTLERFYGIEENQILYIHGRADSHDEELTLGHGIDPMNFERKPPVPPADLSDEEMEMWEQDMADQYDHSYELGYHELESYFSRTFKETTQIIAQNKDFFDALSSCDEVYILGHSLADVDLPYFQAIIKNLDPKVQFVVSYYGDKEREAHKNTLNGLGLSDSNVSLVTLSSLVVSK